MRAAAEQGVEVEPVAEAGRAGGQAGAMTMVGAAINKNIRDRCTMGSSTSHPRRCRNSRTHGNSSNSSSSSTSRNFHRDHTTSSPIPGAAEEDHPTISSEEERTTSVDHNIGEDIRLTSSA